MKKFVCGFLTGTAVTLGALAGTVYVFKKTVIEPIEEKEEMIEENRRRAARKSHARSY